MTTPNGAGPTVHTHATADPTVDPTAPHPADNLDGWHINPGEDPEGDDQVLLAPDGTEGLTWREGYPYDERMRRTEYEATKRVLQIELLKLQSWGKETGQ